MSLPILEGVEDWPQVLTARAAGGEVEDLSMAQAGGAWQAFERATGELSPEAVIHSISESGLRGLGGAGYPAGAKWRDCVSQPDAVRYIVANGYEADPGAQLDRVLMERDPHLVVEGVAIAAWAIGAEQAIIAVSSSAGVAAERLEGAIEEAEAAGFVGRSTDGPSLEIEVRRLTGTFMVGEETVLLRALEGKRAQPDQRPPYPSRRGLWGRPTVVNNVKTLAAVPWIVTHGAGAYASLGTPESPGTTLVQLGGSVKRPGVVEVPFGTTLGQIIDGPGGGTKGKLKAVLAGGPTGGFLPADALDTPLAYEALREAGALGGSSTLMALDDKVCLVDLATLMTRFLGDSASGKTIPDRIGIRRLAELGAALTTGHARPSDPELLEALAADMRAAALSGLEADAGNPLLSVMRYFGPELEAHAVRGECPAGVCQPIRLAGVPS